MNSGDMECGLWVDHYDPTYSGWYEEDDAWFGFPHYVNEDSWPETHLYWLDFEEYGYWQFTTVDQSFAWEAADYYDGGYMYCAGEWYECPNNYDV